MIRPNNVDGICVEKDNSLYHSMQNIVSNAYRAEIQPHSVAKFSAPYIPQHFLSFTQGRRGLLITYYIQFTVEKRLLSANLRRHHPSYEHTTNFPFFKSFRRESKSRLFEGSRGSTVDCIEPIRNPPEFCTRRHSMQSST